MQRHAPTNPKLAGTIGFLKRKGRQTQTPLWTAAAGYLGKSRRSRIVLNLGQVSRHAREGDTILVPGKVLSSGEPTPKLTIAAFKFSPRALVKMEKAGGRCIPISRLVEENPQATKVKLLR